MQWQAFLLRTAIWILLYILPDKKRGNCIDLLLHQESFYVLLGNIISIRSIRLYAFYVTCDLVCLYTILRSLSLKLQDIITKYKRKLLVFCGILCSRRNIVLFDTHRNLLSSKLLPLLFLSVTFPAGSINKNGRCNK